MPVWFFILAQFALLAYAIISGVFLAFSDFIMRALARTSGSGGAEAMQIINREVFRWVFMALFLGLAPVSLLITGYSLFAIPGPAGVLIALSGATYLIGCFGVTIAFNVPMNEALAALDLSKDATRDYWTGTYVPRWTRWNTVRTVACAVSSALLLMGLLWIIRSPAG